jgi:hypothetical protein
MRSHLTPATPSFREIAPYNHRGSVVASRNEMLPVEKFCARTHREP